MFKTDRVLYGWVAGPLALLLAVLGMVWAGLKADLESATNDSRNYAVLVEARLESALRAADKFVHLVAYEIPIAALEPANENAFAASIEDRLKLVVQGYPELGGMRVFDAKGDLLYSSLGRSTPKVNIADREHFKQSRDSGDDRVVFSDVIVGRTAGQLVVAVSRALRDKGGHFLGVLTATLDLNAFNSVFKTMPLGAGLTIAVYRSDSFKQVLRWPEASVRPNMPLPPDSPTRLALYGGATDVTITLKSASDGETRIYSYKVLSGYPFFVSVGISHSTIYAKWWKEHAALGGVSIALLVLAIWAFVRLQRARDELALVGSNLAKEVDVRTAELRASLTELESFAYSVAHDLRTPLRSIAGFSHLLEEGHRDRLDTEGLRLLSRIRGAAVKMGQLIEDLLALTRTTRVEMVRQQLDMSGKAQRVMEGLRVTEPGRGVEFVCQPDLTAQGDRVLIRAVLENLLGNAWKFTGRCSEARIEFGCMDDGPEKIFFVRDNGAGFDMAYVGQLFKPFERLHAEHIFPGTGIGLASVHRIVQRHGGRAWAEGKVGAGATFYFTLEPRPGTSKPGVKGSGWPPGL